MSVESYSRLALVPAEQGRRRRHTSAPPPQPQTATPTPERGSMAITSQKIDIEPNRLEGSSPGGTASAVFAISENEAEEDATQFGFADVTEILEDGASRPDVMLTSKSKQKT